MAAGTGSTVPGGENDTVMGSYGFATTSIRCARHSNSAAFNGTNDFRHPADPGVQPGASFGVLGIDDPRNPREMALNQYTVGSSEMILIYRGAAQIGQRSRWTSSCRRTSTS